MGQRRKSRKWIKEHIGDPYVQRAQREGWRSRAVFKLEEIDQRDRLIRSGMRVVDLGAAPGGWSQYVARALKGRGQVFAVDILDMAPIEGVTVLRGDFRETEVLDELRQRLGDNPVDLVISDMAPNITGISAVDQPASIYLAELALDLACKVLPKGGGLLLKAFQGEGFDNLLKELREKFEVVRIRKPKASKGRSREVYLVAQNYRMV